MELKIFLKTTNLRTWNSYSFWAWFAWQARHARRTLKRDGLRMIMTHAHALQNLNINH